MKTRIALAFSAFLLLLAIGVASAQPEGPAVVGGARAGDYVLRSDESSVLIGKRQMSGVASGGQYRLTPLSMPSDQAGCTCTPLFLPMTRR